MQCPSSRRQPLHVEGRPSRPGLRGLDADCPHEGHGPAARPPGGCAGVWQAAATGERAQEGLRRDRVRRTGTSAVLAGPLLPTGIVSAVCPGHPADHLPTFHPGPQDVNFSLRQKGCPVPAPWRLRSTLRQTTRGMYADRHSAWELVSRGAPFPYPPPAAQPPSHQRTGFSGTLQRGAEVPWLSHVTAEGI